MPYRSICGHRWAFVGDGNFVCEWCGALGYQRPKAPGAKREQEKIYVRRCAVKGCLADAVVRKGARYLCRAHSSRRS